MNSGNDLLRSTLCSYDDVDRALIKKIFQTIPCSQESQRIVLILYAPGHKRIVVSRAGSDPLVLFMFVFQLLLSHPRRSSLVTKAFRLQVDFIVEPTVPVNLSTLGMSLSGSRHFEIGIDGLIFRGQDGKTHLFLPGDAYVRSIMGMRQLRSYLISAHGEEYIRSAKFFRFRSVSYLSSEQGWLQLYRGYPLVGKLTKKKLVSSLDLAIDHIQRTQQNDGRFLYYYDAARDSRRDHEHPRRDPDKKPYYNILRHCGGGLTCVFYEKLNGTNKTLDNIRRAIDFLRSSTRYQEYQGKTGAYIYSERKAKLGGTGIALYLAAEYQMLTGDTRYQKWASELAWHLVHQITASGEFIYYNIYLDHPISEEENARYFSFYYPGEAVCGLAKYLHLVDAHTRIPFFEKLHRALHFLLIIRPKTRAKEYTAIPSDSWLMMGIKELWHFEEMRKDLYADFVFSDARKMVAKMYTEGNAPYPDYAGAFYYDFGDYPYADGARCEGLLAAYQLANKMDNYELTRELWPPLQSAAWSLLHLVNTPDAIYSAPNPALALGGIRFKYTRQWFRIDTIQHVASFFAKLLVSWESQGTEREIRGDYSRVTSPIEPDKHNNLLQIIEAKDLSSLDRHADAWDDLIRKCPSAYPIQTYGWIRSFYQNKLQAAQNVFCLFAYDGELLVGVMPLIRGATLPGMSFSRQFYMAPYDINHTIRNDFLALPGYFYLLESFCNHVFVRSKDQLPAFRFRRVPADSPTLAHQDRRLAHLCQLHRLDGGEQCIDLPTDFGTYLASLDGKFVRELRRQQKRLTEAATVQYRLRDTTRTVKENLLSFIELENSGWKRARQTTIRSIPGDPNLFLAAAESLTKNKWVEWNFLEADGEPIAAQFVIRINRTLFIWKIAYNEKFANCAPGHLLLAKVIENSITQGDVDTINFLATRRWLRVWNVTRKKVGEIILFPRNPSFAPLLVTAKRKNYRFISSVN